MLFVDGGRREERSVERTDASARNYIEVQVLSEAFWKHLVNVEHDPHFVGTAGSPTGENQCIG